MKSIALLALSQVADVASTMFAISRGAHELNPVVGFLMERGGIAVILLFKVAVVVFAAYLMVRAVRHLRHVRLVNGVVVGVSVLVFSVAAMNAVSWI